MKNLLKLFVLIIAISFIYSFFRYDLGQYLTLEYLKENQSYFVEYYTKNKLQTILLFSGVYILSTALSLPGATILTLAAGALFGFVTGTVIVSFASTIGATLAFLVSRFLLKEIVQKKFSDKLKAINEGIEKEGGLYLFSLRLLPVFPFFMINLLMGLTPISVSKYFFVSQVGMLAATMVYVNAGVQIASIESLSGILSPSLVMSFCLLGFFPMIVKKMMSIFKNKRIYSKFKRPKKYEYNMVVIGAGSAGLVTSYISAAVKAKVALIEKHKMGGDCLNTGCVPSKAIISCAKMVHNAKKVQEFGIDSIEVKFDFAKIMERVQRVIKKIEPHDSVERYSELGVECIEGSAQIISPWEVKVGDRILTTKNITIATGARPFIPPIPGLDEVDYVISDNIWDIRKRPEKFLVLGGGPIGLELAQSFSRLGSEVVVLEMAPRIMVREDEDVSAEVAKKFKFEGIDLLTNHKAVKFRKVDGVNKVTVENDGKTFEIDFDLVLIAIGRRPNVKGFGLEQLGVELRANSTIAANDFLQTNYPNIYVCGDVTGPYQLTHTASHQAWYCAVNGLFGQFKKFKVDYSVIPWCTYTDPEVASVGANELTLKEQGVAYDVTKYGIDDLDRAIADGEDYGFVKVLTVKGKDKILGATIVGNNAGNLILEFVCAMKFGKGLNDILGTIHIYPTMGEANKYAAGVWKRANTPEKLLSYVEKFHKWNRS